MTLATATAPIRSCATCLTKPALHLHTLQQRSLRTLVKPPTIPSRRLGPAKPRGTSHTTTATATTRSSLNHHHHLNNPHRQLASYSKISRTSTGKRRKATLTLAADASTSSSAAASSTAAATMTATTSAANRNLLKELMDVLSAIMGKPRTIPIPRWVTPKHYSITYSECFGHASFILVAISYAVDDFLWLRIIAVAGSTSMLFFTYFHPHGRVLWLPFKWNCLFIAINSYRIGKIFLDRYLADRISGELLHLRSKHFFLMDPVDFAKLTRAGTVESFRQGDVIIQQDQPNSHVRVVLSGGLKVLRDGGLTYTLDEGNFIAESGLHAGLMLPGSIDSCCTIVAESDVRLLTWNRSELIDLLHRTPHLRRAIKAVLSWDIVRKLKAQRIMLANHVIDDPDAWTDRRQEQTEHRYKAILKCLLTSHPQNMEKRKKELNKYRTIHHIDDEHHREALKECGWTEEEYEAGYQKNSPTDQANKTRHGPEWYIREVIERLVG